MYLVSDHKYSQLSSETINKLRNCFKNCNKHDIADHLLFVFSRAANDQEIQDKDVWRLVAKALFTYQAQADGEQSVIYRNRG